MSYHIKQSTIRRLTRLAKSLRPLMKRVPNALPKPGSTAYPAPKEFSASQAQKRQEVFEKADSRRLDKTVIRFFAESSGFSEERRK